MRLAGGWTHRVVNGGYQVTRLARDGQWIWSCQVGKTCGEIYSNISVGLSMVVVR